MVYRGVRRVVVRLEVEFGLEDRDALHPRLLFGGPGCQTVRAPDAGRHPSQL